MRKLAPALAALALLAPLAATSAPGQIPPAGDHSHGEGHVLETDFVFSSRAGPNGENITGTLTTTGYLNWTATLTCGSSSGNAVVGGTGSRPARWPGAAFSARPWTTARHATGGRST